MKGMTDWNELTTEQYIEHLEEKFKFDSSGTAKAVFELINAYKSLLIPRVVPEGTLCELDGKQVMVRFKITKYIPKIVIDDI